MYKFALFLIIASLFLCIQFFNSKEMISYKANSLVSEELGNDSVYVELQTPMDRITSIFSTNDYSFPDNGNVILNDFRKGVYVMGDNSFSKKELTLLANNTAKLVYSLPESNKLIYEVGFWRNTKDGKNIELRIIGSQFGTYKTLRNFIFEIQDGGKKIISTSYDNPLYGSGGFVFYKK